MIEGGTEDKTTLAQKDIRFARTIQRLQRALVSEFEKLAVVHLFTLGFRGPDLISFKLSLNNPSRLAELQEIEHIRTKFDLANNVVEGMFSKHWIAKNILQLTDEEFLRNQREAFYDRKYQAALDTVTEQAAAESAAAMAPPPMPPGDVPMEEEEGMVPPEGAPGLAGANELGAEPAAEEGEESTLLAAPGRREDHPTPASLEPQAKGKRHYGTKDDDRRLRKPGPTTRKLRSMAKAGAATSHRDVFPGHELLNTNALFENMIDSSYDELAPTYSDAEEVRLLENTRAIRKLITELEDKEAETETKSSEKKAQ
jgi:hypothetical protein